MYEGRKDQSPLAKVITVCLLVWACVATYYACRRPPAESERPPSEAGAGTFERGLNERLGKEVVTLGDQLYIVVPGGVYQVYGTEAVRVREVPAFTEPPPGPTTRRAPGR